MANVKINQLPLATTPLTGTEVFPLVQGTTTKQVSVANLFTDPVMVNPTLGTVGQADLINATGLPISTGVSGLGSGIATFLGTPSSANLRAAVTDETGTGALVFATSPTLVTPDLGTPTAMVATNITGTALGLIAGSAVTNANLTGAVTSVGNATSLGSFTSAQLRTALTDETGSGVAVFATSPTLVTPDLGTPSAGVLTNATGLPLTTGVTGTLGLGNGGTGQTTANAAFNALAPSQTGNSGKYLTTDGTNTSWGTNPLGTVTSVDVSGGTTGLTTSGGPITSSGTITIGGTLATTNGGTGLTSFTANGVLYASSTSALTSGSALTFDGTNLGVGNALGSTFEAANDAGRLVVGAASGNEGLTIYSGATSLGIIDFANSSAGVGTYAGFLQYNHSANALLFGTSSAEQMRLTSTGLGIGTSSPSQKLEVNTAVVGISTPVRISNSSATTNGRGAGLEFFGASNTFGRIEGFWAGSDEQVRLFSTGSMTFSSGGTTERMRLDSAGNLGLGVTPSAWNSGYKAFVAGGTNGNDQVGGIASGSGITIVSTNYYRSSTPDEIYAGTGYAMKYLQTSGQHQWYTAASGTAGNAISFTQAMTLDASGNLGVGTTSPQLARAHFTTASTYTLNLQNDASNQSGIIFSRNGNGAASSTAIVGNGESTGYLYFLTGGSERARIDSSGTLKVGPNPTVIRSSLFVVGGAFGGGTAAEINNTDSSGGWIPLAFHTAGSLVGYISSTTTTTAYVTSSDYRLKNTIAPMTGALAKVAALKPCTYKWNADGSDGEGFIAHELAEVCPHAVVGEKDAVDEEGNPKYQGIDTSFLVATLTAAIQEQQAIIESLKARLDAANL